MFIYQESTELPLLNSFREFDKTTPIIALTAISLDENRDMLLSFGMNDVITKPFVPDEFYMIIAKFFD